MPRHRLTDVERHRRLAEACSLLDPIEERAMAEEGIAADVAIWPEYLVEEEDRDAPTQ